MAQKIEITQEQAAHWQAFLEALRAGRWAQGRGWRRYQDRDGTRYCPLGTAADFVGVEWGNGEKDIFAADGKYYWSKSDYAKIWSFYGQDLWHFIHFPQFEALHQGANRMPKHADAKSLT